MDYMGLIFLAVLGVPLAKQLIEMNKRGASQIARIPFYGTIQNAKPNDSMPPVTTPRGLEAKLDAIAANRKIKGIVLDIHSGGGEAGASQSIYDLVRKVELPKIAYVNSICASGAYMAACACDEIVAAKGSFVGSIGVIMQSPMVEELMRKIGVKMQTIKSGRNKDMMSMYREMTPEQEAMLRRLVDRSHKRFVDLVYESRKDRIGRKKLEEFATGEITDGEGAFKLGLVDRIGNFDAAVKACEDRGKFKHSYILTMIDKQSIFSRMFSRAGMSFGRGVAESVIEMTDRNNSELHYR